MDELTSALNDYVATVNSGKYGDDIETLMSKFPELQGYEQGALNDYVATSNSNKYDEETLKSKFPEFFGTDEQAAPEVPKEAVAEESGDSASPSADTDSSLDSNVDEGLKAKDEAARRIQKRYEDAGVTEYEINDEDINREVESLIGSDIETTVGKINGEINLKKRKSYLANLVDNFKAGSAELGKGMASIPETLYNVAAMPQNLFSKLTGVDLEASSSKFKKDFDITNPILDYYVEESKALQKTISEFNEGYESSSVYENIKKGNYGDAFALLGSGIVQSAPISLSMMVGGAATTIPKLSAAGTVIMTGSNRQELEEENPEMSALEATIKSIGLAGAETVFSAISQGSLGKVYKDIIAKEGIETGAIIFKKGLVDMYTGALKKHGAKAAALGEGIEEVATTMTQNMIKGRPLFEGVPDAFIQGVGGGAIYGAPLSIGKVKSQIEKAYDSRQIDKVLESDTNTFNKVSDAFNKEFKGTVTTDKLKIISKRGAYERLEKELSEQEKNGDVSPEESQDIKKEFLDTHLSLTKIEGIGLGDEDATEAVKLINRKEVLKGEIKNLDEDIASGKKQELLEISDKIVGLINKGEETTADKKAGKEPTAKPEEVKPTAKPEEVKPTSITAENSSNFANMTEDGEGNFVFFHRGKKGYGTVKRGTGASRVTSREEAAALGKVGGLAMYYTNKEGSEKQGSDEAQYAVKVAKDNVYDFNNDALNLIDKARELHKKEHPDKAFDHNTQVAYVAKIAGNMGFEMVVAEWAGTTRAQTTSELAPTDVRETDGAEVTKEFKGKYESNKDKGFESVIPKTKKQALAEAYDVIHNERNKDANYDKAYSLYSESDKYTQDEITKIIEESDLSKESKDAYKEALAFKQGKRKSKKTSEAAAKDIDADLDAFMGVPKAESAKATEATRTKVQTLAERAKKALSRIAPNAKINIYNTTAEFEAATGKKVAGLWSPNKGKGGTISINLDYATGRTVAHETVHAVLGTMIKSDKALERITDKFLGVLAKNVDGDVKVELDKFMNLYADNPDVKSEEFTAELGGMLADNYTKLSNKAQGIVKQWLDTIAKKLGLKEFTDSEIIDLLNKIADKTAKGEVITEADVAILSDGAVITGEIPSGIERKGKQSKFIDNLELERLPTHKNIIVKKGFNLRDIAGQVASSTLSDKLVAGRLGDFLLYGGVGYPEATGLLWAASNKTSADKITNKIKRSKDGFNYLMPAIMSNVSHMSNRDMTVVAIETLKEASKNGEIDLASLTASIEKAFSNKSLLKLQEGALNAIEGKTNINETLDALLDYIFTPKFTFVKRRNLLQSIIGDAKSQKPKYSTVGTFTKLAGSLAEPLVKDSEIYEVNVVYRTKGTLRTVKIAKTDPRYHKSYPYAVESSEKIEVLHLVEGYNLVDIFPEFTKADGDKKSLKQELEDKLGEYTEKYIRTNHGRTHGLSSYSAPIVADKPIRKDKSQRTDKASEKLVTLFDRDNVPLTIPEAKEMVNEVLDWADWYDGLSGYVNKVFGEYGSDVLSILPLASMGNGSAGTVTMAINNVEKIYKGERPSGLAEYYNFVTDFLEGKGIKSDKMYNFFKALLGDPNAVAVDMHVYSIIKWKDSNKKQVNPANKKEFAKAKEFVNTLAKELGMQPREVQASLWALNILRTGGKPDSYEQYIEKHIKEKNLYQRVEGWREQGYKPFSEVREAKEAELADQRKDKSQRTGQQNEEFFTGKAAKASSDVAYKPVVKIDQTTPVAKAYDVFSGGGNFTGHISKMIAGFQEKQIKVAEAIVKGGFKSFLDIGASEGGLAKTVASQNKNMKAIALDPNSQMKDNFNSTPEVTNTRFVQEAYQGSWTEGDGTEIKEFKPSRRFDVVNEDFAFQFINNGRDKQVKGVKNMMSKNGVFITSEKFIETDNYDANEEKKYDHQRNYFNESELTKDKQEIVTGMAEDMVNDKDYEKTLNNNFKHVEEYWNSGNFKGYVASDNKEVLDKFIEDVGDLTTEFTDKDSPLLQRKEKSQKVGISYFKSKPAANVRSGNAEFRKAVEAKREAKRLEREANINRAEKLHKNLKAKGLGKSDLDLMVEYSRGKGYSDPVIKDALTRRGFSEAAIDAALKPNPLITNLPTSKQATKLNAALAGKVKTLKKKGANRKKAAKMSNTKLFKQSWDSALDIVSGTISNTGNFAQAMHDGVESLRNSDWYRKLSNSSRAKAERMFREDINRQYDGDKVQSSWKDSMKASIDKMQTSAIQKLIDKYHIVRKAVGDNFNISDDSVNFSQAEINMHGKAANDIDVFEKKLDKIMKEIAGKGLEVQDVSDYLYAKHAAERNAYIKKFVDGENEFGSGMTPQEIDKILNRTYTEDQIKDLEALSEKFYEIVKGTRDIMLEGGLITAEQHMGLSEFYENYVPLTGFDNDEILGSNQIQGKKLDVAGHLLERSSGRSTRADNVIANLISARVSAVVKARKNEVLQTLYNLGTKEPKNGVFTVYTNENLPKTTKVDKTGKKIEQKEDARGREDYVGVKVDGEQYWLKFANEELGRVLNASNIEKSNVITKLLRSLNRYLSTTLTTLNPEFVISNFSRDIQTAVLNVMAEADVNPDLKGQNLAKDVVKDTFSAIKAIYTNERLGKVDTEYQKYYEEFKADGAKTGWANQADIASIKKRMENLVKSHNAKGVSATNAKAKTKAVLEFVNDVNTAVENGVRLAAYANARKAGVTRAQAARMAKELTVNFNKSGEYGTVLNSMYLFFNAAIQGNVRFVKAMTTLKKTVQEDGTVKKSLNRGQKLAIALTTFSAVMTLLNQAMSDDDEDGESFYSKIPDFEKERNLIMMNPMNGKDYFKIPLPYGYNVFHNFGTVAAEVARGDREVGDGIGFLVSAMVGAFSPVSFGGGDNTSAVDQVVNAFTPTIAKPIVDLSRNEDYFGGQIYNENFPMGTPKPESSLGRRSTPEAFKAITTFLNEVSGGNVAQSGSIDISPESLYYMYKFAIGGTGKFLQNTAETAGLGIDIATGQDKKLEVRKIPFARKVYGEPNKYADQSKFFDNYDEIRQMESALELRVASPEDRRNKKRILQAVDAYKAASKELKLIRKERKVAEGIESPVRRTRELNKLEDKYYTIIRKTNGVYNKNLKKINRNW